MLSDNFCILVAIWGFGILIFGMFAFFGLIFGYFINRNKK